MKFLPATLRFCDDTTTLQHSDSSADLTGTRKNGPRKNGLRKNGPREKWSPEKWCPGKMVPGKLVPEKLVPKNWSPENWSPENWSQEKWSSENRSPEKCRLKIVLRQKNARKFARLFHFYQLIPLHTQKDV